MNKKLYKLMDWSDVEEVVYAESLHPDRILGSHNVGNNSLIQCFYPEATKVVVVAKTEKNGAEEIVMDLMDEEGFFACLVPGKDVKNYYYQVYYSNRKKPIKSYELYNGFKGMTEKDKDLIASGEDMDIYKKLGAKVCTKGGIKGTVFSVYAPNALRVSVIGEFNNYNGKAMQMMCDEVNGIFELFVPGVTTGEAYRYEILVKGGAKYLKCDPFSMDTTTKEDGVYSVVSNPFEYDWKDDKYIKNNKNDLKSSAVNIYEIEPGSYNNGFAKLADKLIPHLREYGYTHVSLMPIFEHYNDSNGYVPSFLYAINHKLGTFKEFAEFVNNIHEAGFGVVLQMALWSFDGGLDSIACFDGSCLFEHADSKKGIDPRNGARCFQFGNSFVEQYITAAVVKWVNDFHIDGLEFTDLGSVLYLDYYRDEWIPNIYGSNENLEAISFIKKLNKKLHQVKKGFFTIADEETGWPDLTLGTEYNSVDEENCLGFDFAFSKGFNQDVIPYMSQDPIERSKHHHELTLSTVYQYRENYIISLGHSDCDFGKGRVIESMWGDEAQKISNYKAFITYLMTHSGKKRFFMGQDQAMYESFDYSTRFIDSGLSNVQVSAGRYVADLMKLLVNRPALYKFDYSPKGFEWINNFSANENVVVFLRKAEENLVVVINFAN